VRKLVLVTGGFDPLHKGHIAYLEAAYKLGDGLVVGLNSDAWLQRKKGKHFLDFDDRKAVLDALWMVDDVIAFDDSDDSARAAIQFCLDNTEEGVIFANGGDRTSVNIPEMDVMSDRLHFVFGVGGQEKLNSSSWILERWNK
jgi:D-beta-D-heptose 7-phosphate kinase/D-beta-D-heptose 1-phosphate adenosyltransferase